MLRFPRAILFAVCVLAAALVPAGAQSVPEVESRLRPAVVLPGQSALLEIEMDDGLVQTAPVPPVVDGLEIAQAGVNRLIRDRKVRVVVVYRVKPQRSGAFSLPPVAIKAGGRDLATSGHTLTVLTAAEAGPPPPASRKVHALLLVAKRDPYVGERIPIQLLVLVDPDALLQTLETPVLPRDGFAMDRMENPTRDELTYGGRSWLSFAYPLRVTPLSAGKLQLGPATCAATVAVPDDSGGGIFQRMRSFRLPATSVAVPLEVQPLPAGQPAGFSGAVGDFTLSSAFDPAPQHAGDPAAVRLVVRGSGDPANITVPHLPDESNWEIFEGSQDRPQEATDRESSEVVFRRILRPKGTPPAEVGPFEFPFFNPGTGHYVVARSLPLPLPQGLAPSSPAPPAASLPAAPAPPVQLEPGAFIATVPAAARWSRHPRWIRPALWSVNVGGMTLLLSLVVVSRRRRYLASADGQRAVARRQFGRRLRALAAIPDESERLVGALRWVEDWQSSPAARRLRPDESTALAAIARRLDQVRYAPADSPAPPVAPDLQATLARLLR